MKNLLFILLFISGIAKAQPATSLDTTITGTSGGAWSVMVDLPPDYYTTGAADSFMLYLWFTGNDGGNTGHAVLDDQGFHYWIRQQGWDGNITLGNGVHRPIYISINLPYEWQNPVTSPAANSILKPKLDAILNRYRVKANSTVAFAISAGAGTMQWFHTWKPTADDDTYAEYFEASVHIVERAHTSTEGSMLGYPQRWGHTAVLGHTALSFHQTSDGTETGRVWTDNMRDSVANSATFLRTAIDGGGHRGWNTVMNPNERNWTTTNSNVLLVEGPTLGTQNVYEWAARQCDTNFVSNGNPVAVSAGSDFSVAYDQDDNTPDFDITSSITLGSAESLLWTLVSGPNTPTLTNSTSATVTISGATKGHYIFKITATDASANTDEDEVSVWVRDYNEAGSWPCREGGGQVFEIGNTLISGIVATTYINLPYINRAPYTAFGEQILGGDTIKIHPNPNNGGVWNTIVTGYVGGSEGCPVVIMPYDTVPVLYGSAGGYWRMASAATGDTNFVNHVKVDGLAHRVDNRYVYGFQFTDATKNGLGMVAHLIRNFELCGLYSYGGPIFMKKDSDSTKVYSLYNNFNPGKLIIHDNYVTNTEGEGYYLGTTDVDGGSFDGPTHKGSDSSQFYRLIITHTGWDGFQVSNYGQGVMLRHVVTYNTGTVNQSSQQSAGFIGGYTQGKIDSCVFVNSTGGPQLLGKGLSYFWYNIVDSIQNGGAVDYDNFYGNQAIAGVPPPLPDSLQISNQYNIYNRMEETAANHANSNGRMKAGFMRYNTAVHPTFNESQLFTSNAGCTISDNTILTAIDLDTTSLALNLPAWAVYKLIATDSVTKYSFFDVEGGNINPMVDAGNGQTITLPTSSISLSGTASDVDGSVSTYAWTKTSGGAATITDAASASTTVTGLVAGTYVFRLTVTDNDGATNYDEVTIVVNPLPSGQTLHIKRVF